MIQLFTGLLMSSVHVITGPDHLAAVTPLAIESRSKAWHVGLFWGFGHVLGMLLIGLLYFTFREIIPVEKISLHSELLVGVVLILIGCWSLVKARAHLHPHHIHPHLHTEPFPYVHIHKHGHEGELEHYHTHERVFRQNNLTALLVGTLHGFAGVSHFLLILPTLALPSTADSVAYLSGFGSGTILTMVIYSIILGSLARRSAAATNHQLFGRMRVAAGIIAIMVGLVWILLYIDKAYG
jgi:sulfite exporter TauE/SafE